jgi:hypothetical protein
MTGSCPGAAASLTISSGGGNVGEAGDLLVDMKETIYADSVHFYCGPDAKAWVVGSWQSGSPLMWRQDGVPSVGTKD